MSIEVGTKYQIANMIKSFYNSAETLTVTRLNDSTVQFLLGDGKGHGSMPVQHFNYLLKRSELSKLNSKRILLSNEDSEKDIS